MPPKKAAANSSKPYAKGESIPPGEVLTDLANKQWKVGKSIGSGGFGDIYLASEDITKAVNDKANYVVKIEPFTNGPLFVEIAFYIRAAKAQMIDEWKQQHKMDSLGMPHYVASGSLEYKSNRYRFLVIPRFGQDLYKIVSSKPGKILTPKSVFAVALQIIDIYQYIHSKEFVHADVKASNLALELNPNPKKKHQQLYLLDYGLVTKFVDANGQHSAYAPDARKAHNGTLEYASRDAHIGAFARRGDFEVLGYNMLEWLCGKLPWSQVPPPTRPDGEFVLKQKKAFMADISLKKIYGDVPGLDIVEKFLKYVDTMEFGAEPDYKRCRDIIRKGIPATATPKGSLFLDEVSLSPTKSKTKKAGTKRRSVDEGDSEEVKRICVPLPSDEPKRSTRTTKTKDRKTSLVPVFLDDPEKMVRAASLSQQSTPVKNELNGMKPPSPVIANPTPAMLQILSKKKENIRSPLKSKGVHMQPSRSHDGTNELTPAMKEIMMRQKKQASTTLKKKAKPATNGVSPVARAPSPVLPTRPRRNK